MATVTIRAGYIILYDNYNIYPSINTFYNYISADSIAHNFSCTDMNNNLQLKTAKLLKLD